jgi:Holliday junction DNA helicase RuvA
LVCGGGGGGSEGVIASLKGVLDFVAEESVIVDVGGVGYLVFCSGRTLSKLPQVGEAVRFVVETHVREDHIHLYGFSELGERDWFRLLTTVQGVGAKVGLAILSALGPEELVQAVVAQDKAVVSRANGVGPKLAGRIVLELKDKVSGLAPVAFEISAGPRADVIGSPEDAVSALVNLGFQRTDAFGAVARAGQKLGEGAEVDALIRAGLQELSQ